MTTRDEIIDLVRKCAEPDGDFGIDNAIALFQAAQRQAYERAAKCCDARYMGDNNREDMEAKRCAEAIRSLKV